MDKLTGILNQMTITEKVLQLFQLHTSCYREGIKQDYTGPDNQIILKQEEKYAVGSLIGELADVAEMGIIQEEYAEQNRLGIPPMVMADIIHGYKTIFPIPLGMSCTFDEELIKKASRIAAVEATACGVHATFAPMADLVRDPRWGRCMESTGEDPYLNALFARAAVMGFQGDDLKDKNSLVSCVKHLAAYGAPEGGREYNTVDISRAMLRGYYLDGYKAAIEAGCQLVMTAFNTVDLIPATCNKWLFTTLLREEWGFTGAVISDWGAIGEVVAHGAAKDAAEAARKCLDAGVDIDMMSGVYPTELIDVVESDAELMQKLDDAVLRVLRVKENAGLFGPPKLADSKRADEVLLCHKHRQAALEIAEKSIVLLKNNGLLPLERGQKIALVGSMAAEKGLNGWWSCQGEDADCVTLADGLKALGESVVMPKLHPDEEGYLEECCRLAGECDAAIVVCGEKQEETGEGSSKADLHLDKPDTSLIELLHEQGSRIAVVIHSGRPLMITRETELADAVVAAWFLGTESGNALARILLGEAAPQGRLTMTIPRHQGQIPIYYNHFNTGRPKSTDDLKERYISKYIDCPNRPLFPFGYGLLYTEMEYSDLALSSHYLKKGGEIVVSIRVKNTGRRTGVETVQLYIRDHFAAIVRPVMELKGKKQIELAPGTEASVCFTVTEEMLGYYDMDGSLVTEAGDFTVFVGKNAEDTVGEKFEYKE